MIENDDDILILKSIKDKEGIAGDVRDIVIRRDNINWEIGLSIKHNHEAVKHSRLSPSIDFGKEWYNIPCSNNYWPKILPIFERLKTEKSKGTKWSQLQDKQDSIYLPLLQSFMDEVQRAYAIDHSMARRMVEYLIGVKDFYKIISLDNKYLTLIRMFNLHNTLNKPSKIKISAIKVPVVSLPTELTAIKLKRNTKTTIEMYFNNGWQLNFRIHSAETKVIPSLKFDIQFVGMPVSVMSFECRWHSFNKEN